MRALLALLCLIAVPAAAQTTPKKAAHPAATTAKPAASKPASPTAIGRFDDWTAATNQEAGQTVCYAFTRASASTPAVAGRGDVVLTVTQRPSSRDSVAISAGFAYAANSTVTVEIGSEKLDFYTASRSAFARDGHAAVVELGRAGKVIAKSPAPKGGTVTDTFSLKGFSPAYAAINKACPAKAG